MGSNQRTSLLFLFTICFLFFSCSKYSDKERQEDIGKLLQSNEIQRKAHLFGDAELLVSQIADSMTSVRGGNISNASNSEIKKRFEYYFNQVQYIKWDDLEEPRIKISDDGSLAKMYLRKIILIRGKNENDEWEKGATVFAWTATHKKINGRWKIISNTSTRNDLDKANYNEYYSEGLAAYREKDFTKALDNFEKSYWLNTENLAVLYSYSKALIQNNKYEKALKIVDRIADKRFYLLSNIEEDSTFNKLSSLSGFETVLKKIEAAKKPVNNSEIAFIIPEKDLVPEGVAFDNNTGKLYLSSMYKRKILLITKDGKVSDFKKEAEDDLLSTFGMEVDEKSNHLWVVSAFDPQGMTTQEKVIPQTAKSRIHKYDLTTGQLIKKYDYDNKGENHFFNDITVASNGDIYMTESMTSKIYKIPKDKDELELFYQADPLFFFLNGLALNEDESILYVASTEGISALNLQLKNWQLIRYPADVSLEGIDGMAFYNGTLICHQTGYPNNSINQYSLDETGYRITGTKIIESHNPNFDQAATGEIAGNYYYYLANGQMGSAYVWNEQGIPVSIQPMEELEDIVILKVKLN